MFWLRNPLCAMQNFRVVGIDCLPLLGQGGDELLRGDVGLVTFVIDTVIE